MASALVVVAKLQPESLTQWRILPRPPSVPSGEATERPTDQRDGDRHALAADYPPERTQRLTPPGSAAAAPPLAVSVARPPSSENVTVTPG